MTPSGSLRQGGGRRWTVVALGVVAALGVALLVFALSTQVGAPPQPELSGGGSDAGGASPQSQEVPTVVAPSEEPEESEGSGLTGTKAEESATEEEPVKEEGAVSDGSPMPESEPTSISIPSIDVEEELFPIGLGSQGELLAPSGSQANLPAWYEGSPTPGEVGPSVIEGHVTWKGDPSIFFDLGGMSSGDRVEVTREDGSIAVFEVYETGRYPKNDFPTERVYGETQGPELRLITCGGDLDADGHHLDNTVIYLKLVAG